MTSTDTPKVSVIVPVYNGEQFLREAVESALAQTYSNTELLVVNDGSTDGTADILEHYRQRDGITVLNHKGNARMGVSHSRKAAVNHAQGQYIAFLDADDVFHPDKIAVQVEAMETTRDAILCHTGVEIVFQGDAGSANKDHFNVANATRLYYFGEEPQFLNVNHICNPTVMVRGAALQGVAFESKQLFQFEDWLLWILLSEKGPFLYLPEKLSAYRYHPTSATSGVASNRLAWQYSKIELLLCAYSRVKKSELKAAVVLELRKSMIWLLTEYIAGGTSVDDRASNIAAEFAYTLFGDTSENVDNAIANAWDVKQLAKYMSATKMAKATAYKGMQRIKRLRRNPERTTRWSGGG